jgi:hypothetical protein
LRESINVFVPNLYLGRFASDFIVKKAAKGSRQPDAIIFSGNEKIAEIKKEKNRNSFRLVSLKDGLEWLLANDVHGEPRPFSFSIRRVPTADQQDEHDKSDTEASRKDNEVFVVREQIFKHNGNFYMLAGHPQGRDWNEHIHSAVRYINRLDDFDVGDDLDLSQVDYQDRDLRDKIKRLRGIAVGEASGLGIEDQGHHVRIDEELADVGLFIAAISYLIYACA